MVVARTMFAITAAGAITRYADHGWIAFLAAFFLIIIAAAVPAIIRLTKVPVMLLMIIAITLLCVVTQSPYFILVLLVHWVLNKFFVKIPRYEIDAHHIKITTLFTQRTYPWTQVQNLVLKDGLLTIDFLNNHILQYPVISKDTGLDENNFNQFCSLQLQSAQSSRT